jgi:hypothetical protein
MSNTSSKNLTPPAAVTPDELCKQIGDVIHCQCGKPSSHYGTMGYRGAREVREVVPSNNRFNESVTPDQITR